MKKILLLSLILSVYILAADSDMDGVDDAQDQCINTPFSDLVNARGCTIRSLQSNINYDIILGAGYSEINYASGGKSSTTTQTLQADYYNNNVSVQVAGAYFQSSTAGVTTRSFGDTLVALYYKSAFENGLTMQTGISVILPTYISGNNNEAVDYQGSIGLQYNFNDRYNLFGGYSYTMVNDTNVPGIAYQNTQSFYAGAGYSINSNTRLSASYALAQSAYVGTKDIQTASASLFYQLNTNWFTMLDYRHGLSDSASDHDGSLKLGYYF